MSSLNQIFILRDTTLINPIFIYTYRKPRLYKLFIVGSMQKLMQKIKILKKQLQVLEIEQNN